MNDFLKNLRSSRHKSSSDPRRNLDGHYYQNTDRRITTDRRNDSSSTLSGGSSETKHVLNGLLNILPQLADTSAALTLFIDQYQNQNDRLIDIKIENYKEVTKFFKRLNKLLDDQSFESLLSLRQSSSSGYTMEGGYTKEEILELMKKMRDNGATFGEIALYLDKEKIPTFSGKGQWHAQTVHRLCR